MRLPVIIICACVIASHLNYAEARKGKGNKNRKALKERQREREKQNKTKTAAKKAIEARVGLFVKSWNSNNMSTVASISSKDGVLMGQGLDTVYGRDRIYVALLGAKMIFHQIDISINQIVAVNKRYAFHVEEWKGYDSEGHVVVEKARSLIVWKKMKGEWYIVRHMFNYVGNSYR